MTREELIGVFEDTLLWCGTHPNLIESIHNSESCVITDENRKDHMRSLTHRSERKARILVSSKRSFEAASAYRGRHISVLNFASATNPGGGVLKGAGAQEECLCRTSTLYECLCEDEIVKDFHKKHWIALKSGKMDSLYNDDYIHTCDVTVFKSDTAKPVLLPETEWFNVDVISCAAPNLRYMSQHDREWKKKATDKVLFEIYKKRINRVLDMARFMESDVVVLGAFGCGAFANPPELVAKAMHEAIDEHIYDFEVIEMAVYCSPRDTSNYDVFLNEFCV